MAGTAEGAAKARARRAEKAVEVKEPGKRYIVASRVIKHGERVYKPGDVFPFADQIPRLEGWIRTGRLIEA